MTGSGDITVLLTMDNARSMDELHADVKDLNDNLGRLSLLPPNWSGKSKISDWLDTLSSMQVLKEEAQEAQY